MSSYLLRVTSSLVTQRFFQGSFHVCSFQGTDLADVLSAIKTEKTFFRFYHW